MIDTSPAARRAFRKRLLERASTRRPRNITRPNPPNGIELAYTKILRDTSRAMDDAIIAALRREGLFREDASDPCPLCGTLPPSCTCWRRRADAVRELEPHTPEVSGRDIDRLTRYLTRKLAQVSSYKSLAGSIDKMASRLVEYSRTQWQAQLKSSMGIVLTADPDLSKLVDRFRDRQGDLIVSLAKDKVTRVKAVLRELGADATVDTISDRIREETGATESRARLIARTEVSTMNSQLSIARHTAAGIKEFEWSTSMDERVRQSHHDLEGKRFEYANPPNIPGEGVVLPGQFPNCRCTAIPILPGIDD